MWMKKTCGDLETVIDKLNELVPMTGACDKRYTKNKRLDRFRRAQNVIHDIFNNGLMNRGKELKCISSKLRVRDLPIHAYNDDKWDIIEKRLAPYFREIVMDAVLEQFGRKGYLDVCHNRSSQIILKVFPEGRA